MKKTYDDSISLYKESLTTNRKVSLDQSWHHIPIIAINQQMDISSSKSQRILTSQIKQYEKYKQLLSRQPSSYLNDYVCNISLTNSYW